MKFTIHIDHREHTERINNAKEYYESEGDKVTVKELLIGDYLFNNQVVFEYKTLTDFCQSVKKGRVFNQAIDQSTSYPYHFVIIVASDYEKKEYFEYNYLEHLFSYPQYYGAIARLNTYTTVWEVPNEYTAIRVMRQQAKKCLDNKHVIKRLKTKTDNPAFNWLSLLKHIGDDTAELIVDNKNLYSLEDLFALDNNSLQEIKGIGSKTAGIVIRSIKGKKEIK